MYLYDDSKNSICKIQCSPIVIISPREVTELDFYTTCSTDQSKFFNPSPLRLLVVTIIYCRKSHSRVLEYSHGKCSSNENFSWLLLV